MRQLGWQDNFFIVMETPRTPAHASYVSICDPATSPKDVVTFDDITEAFRRRLPLVPTFRRKLVRVPLGLDQAYWLEDADFDLEYHLRELALARPGNWKQLCTQVARLHSRPLDLTRPPWECTMIEGLDAIDGIPEGSFALALKVHHAAIDGVAGVDMDDPIGTVAALCAQIGIEFDDTARRSVQQWLDDHPQDQHGVHRYTAEDFGLDADRLRERFAFYTRRFL